MTIRNCDLDGSGFWGLAMNNVTESQVLDNLFHHCHYGFHADGTGIELRGNTFMANRGEDVVGEPDTFTNDVRTDNTFAFAQDLRDYLFIAGTDSPDCRYGIAWGIPGVRLDRAHPDNRDTKDDIIENYLVDRRSGKTIANLDSNHNQWTKTGREGGNFTSSLSVCWRDDSQAVMVAQGSRWSFERATVVFVGTSAESGKEKKPDVIPLTEPLRLTFRKRALLRNPEMETEVDKLFYDFSPQRWVGDRSLSIESYGQIPKSETLPVEYSESVTLNFLLEPPLVEITDSQEAAAPKDSDSPLPPCGSHP